MTDASETWQEMKDRHALERAEAVCRLRDAGLTQADAARALDMNPNTFGNYLTNNAIPWPIPHKGFKITLSQFREAELGRAMLIASRASRVAFRAAYRSEAQ